MCPFFVLGKVYSSDTTQGERCCNCRIWTQEILYRLAIHVADYHGRTTIQESHLLLPLLKLTCRSYCLAWRHLYGGAELRSAKSQLETSKCSVRVSSATAEWFRQQLGWIVPLNCCCMALPWAGYGSSGRYRIRKLPGHRGRGHWVIVPRLSTPEEKDKCPGKGKWSLVQNQFTRIHPACNTRHIDATWW